MDIYTKTDNAVQAFSELKPYLFSIAYRMLGSVMDAEDMVQETYLRWQAAPQAEVRSLKAYLTTIITRLCIDNLRLARKRREEYVGPWLPEPLLGSADKTTDLTLLSESLSTAFLTLLETLTPVERAVFLLHDVFDYAYDEVGPMVGKSGVNCRQIARRAKTKLSQRRNRFSVSPNEHNRLVKTFLETLQRGDLDAMLQLLTDDVAAYSDGGGKTTAARKPIFGKDRIARFWIGLATKFLGKAEARLITVNGSLGILTVVDGVELSVITFECENGRIAEIYAVLNPDKLGLVRQAYS